MPRKASKESVSGVALPVGKISNVSYSTLDKWFQCPKAVELTKIRKAPTRSAWWFAGGTAVHEATEAYDRWTLLDPLDRPRFDLRGEWERAFDGQVDDISSRQPDRSTWRHAGSKDTPETYDRWKNTVGPELVAAYIRWRQRTGWDIWHTESGVAGIELDLGGTFPGSSLPSKGFADRVFVDPYTQGLTIVDLKSGTRAPDSPLQFGIYAAGLILNHKVSAAFGYAFMNRKGELGKPFTLAKYTPEYVGQLLGRLSKAIENGIFPAHPGQACRMCDVAAACYAADGEFSKLYDPDDPEWSGAVPF